MKKIFSFLAAVLFAGSMMASEAIMQYTGGVTANMVGDGANNAATVGLDADLFTVLADNGGNQNLPGLNKANDIRLYADKNTGNGNTITVSIASGTITSIVLDIKQTATFVVKAGETAVTEENGAYAINATSFSIQNTTTGATTQLQLNKITITYTAEGGETPVDPTPTVLQAVSDSTTWDFSKITANTANALYGNDGIKLTDESTPSKNDEVIYADYSEDFMTIGEEFNKAAIAFKGEYPIRKNQYCQAGTLHFKADVAGTIVVKFSDTGSSASATAVKRYLVVNGEQTEYWTSRENNGEAPYDAQLNVVSGKIEVPAGDVTITGSSAIVMYYVTFVPEEHVYTCAQVQANEATAEGVLNEVTVMFVNGSNVFVKDETGMTQVYLKSNGLAIGDKVSGIKGASTLYKSTPEFVPTNAPADWTVVAGETPVYDEKETIATTADVNGVYVFKNVTFAEATEFTTAEQVNATVTIGEESIVLRNNYKFAYSFTANKAYDVKAVVVIYNNAAQLYFISAEKHISTAISNTAVEGKAVKTITNGMLIIEKNGVKYNVMGQAIR